MNDRSIDRNRRILVIDDNRAIHEDFRKILSPGVGAAAGLDATEIAVFGPPKERVEQTQFEVDSAYQGQEGVLLLKAALERELPYAMAFVDVRMPPGWDGVETTLKLWELDPDLQVVLCTAYSDYSWGEMFERLGHRDGLLILKKPFDAVEALQLAHALTEKWWLHRRSRRELEELERVVDVRTSELRRTNAALEIELVEHERAEETLRESDEKFHLLADNITDAFWIRSADLAQVHYISPSFERIWGRSAASLYAHPEQWTGAIVLEDRERVQAAFAALTGATPSIDLEYRIARPDGDVRWVHNRGFQVRDASGDLIRLTGIAADVTERKKSEDAIRESEERFSGAFEQAPIGVALVSPEGRWLRVNRVICELVGYSEAELLTRTFQDITHPEDLEIDLEQMRRVVTGDIRSYQIEKRYVHRRGHLVAVLLDVSLVRDSRGQPRYFISQIQDITERKRLEAQVFQSQKLETVGTLAGGIAHEFNSILTAIIGQSELLLSHLPAVSPLTKNAIEISRAADRAATLTRQLLAYGRKQFLRPETLDLNRVLASMEGMLQHLMGGQVETHITSARGLQAVRADAGQIEQVIMNMAINARDAMPHGGTLTLETANVSLDEESSERHPELKPGDYVMLAITDTGAGMSDDIRARAFEPFFTTKGVGQGTGLGLSTCYGIIKQSGGHITVSSELARGTTFKIFLPRVARQTSVPAPRLDSPDLPRGTENILLVEEDSALREMETTLLRRLGYSVSSAANAIEALRLKEQGGIGNVDGLITDVDMRPMSGRELSERLLALNPRTRVLFTSAYSEDAVVRQGPSNTSVALLQKPFTPTALAFKLREVLDDAIVVGPVRLSVP